MKNICSTGKDPVLSNLKNNTTKDYSHDIFDNRTVDAKSSLRAFKKFLKTYSLEKLFSLGFECYQAVVRPESSMVISKDPQACKEKIHSFFQENARMFSKLCVKKKRIFSYFYSHEISVDSIMNSQYRPHTHLVFFVPRAEKSKGLPRDVREIEDIFNSNFNDRIFEIERIDSDGVLVPKVSRKYKDIEGFAGYLYRTYSLAGQYLREIREDNVRDLNKATVE
jgi:hypothetical protein